PPVETISAPCPASPRAKSVSPLLSDTEMRARRTGTRSGTGRALVAATIVRCSLACFRGLLRIAAAIARRAARRIMTGETQRRGRALGSGDRVGLCQGLELRGWN